jgi:GT2 family glycosyltransferase
MLISRRAVLAHGYPIADYFTWSDDTEYSGRILRDAVGILCPRSVVMHCTPTKHMPETNTSGRFYYEVRNKLWMLRFSEAWTRKEKAKFLGALLMAMRRNVHMSQNRAATLRTIARGLWDGWMHRPHT